MGGVRPVLAEASLAQRLWRTPLRRGRAPSSPGEVHVIPERCKGCGICIDFCPRDVLAEAGGFNRRGYRFPEARTADLCVECRLCELLCPEFAIYVTAGKAPPSTFREGAHDV